LIKTSGFTLATILSLLSTCAAIAADSFPKAYDATYESKGGAVTIQMHILSNGKGQTRTETTLQNAMKTVIIVDTPANIAYQILEASKTIRTCASDKTESYPIDAAQAKKRDAKSLGEKLVDGHICQGWSYKTGDRMTEVWIDKQTQAMVKSIVTSGGIALEFDLKSLKATEPDSSNFVVPKSGYKVVSAQ
jgi:hypothetical protein